MKVILTAFGGKLESEVMDWPEGSGFQIKMVMDMDRRRINISEPFTPEAIPLHKVGTFVWNGKNGFLADGIEVKYYELIDVS